ncbi:DOMON domain-containing protein FRRS1L [Rhinatrema bivittatum]|uniref:DOMON domain-containing protein FRRS1L n=1 Tax=Rhinatrema bivittatum TaxID=194408 RepID=UPI001126D5E4|nr:DOMON domain-containing protein FRRS1L [Rhinatrema bivittatum]
MAVSGVCAAPGGLGALTALLNFAIYDLPPSTRSAQDKLRKLLLLYYKQAGRKQELCNPVVSIRYHSNLTSSQQAHPSVIVMLQHLGWVTWLLFAGVTRASPADENSARGGRREQGEAALDELHQDTYGTFASEFYDLRYLSEEGYPFPTAPPVDPFAKIRVDDCGKTKGCFRYGKPGCNAETCDYFLSYRRIGADVEFELSADTDGWVAVGYSSDKKMGGDDVMACVHDDNGRVRIQHFYNVGQWAKEIQRNPARDEEGIFENNRVTCRFKRPVYVPRDETIVDLHLSWYYLFAWGPAIQGSITRHDIDSPPVSEHVVSIYKYEDIFMPSVAYQTFSSPFCLLLIVALTFYLLMGTP